MQHLRQKHNIGGLGFGLLPLLFHNIFSRRGLCFLDTYGKLKQSTVSQ